MIWLKRPSTQDWLIQQATKILSQQLKTTVHIEKVDANLFSKLILENVLIQDKKNDTLLFAEQIRVNLTDVFFLKKNFTFNYIYLAGAKINLTKSLTDSTFNYQFLVDALAGNSDKKNDSLNWKINFRVVELKNISLHYNDQQQKIIDVKLANFKLQIDGLDLNKKSFRIASIILQQPVLSYWSDKTQTKKLADDKKNKSVASDKQWHISADKFLLEDGILSYCISTKDSSSLPDERFNPNDFKFRNIDINASSIVFNDSTIEAQFKQISAKEKCGLQASLSTNVVLHKKDLKLNNLKLHSPYSNLDEELELVFSDVDVTNLEKIFFKTKIKKSIFSPKDIVHFVAIPNWLQPIEVEGEVNGDLSSIRCRNVQLTMGSTYFQGNFKVKGLPDYKNTFINFEAKQLTTNGNELLSYLPLTKHPELLQRFGDIFFSGNFEGFINDFVAKGKLKTSLGDVASDVNMKISEKGILNYDGNITALQFNVGQLINDSAVGKISISADINGKGWLNQNPEVAIQGLLQKFDFNHYSYQNITLNGVLKQNQFDGKIISTDPNLNFDFNGVANLNDTLPRFNFDAQLHSIDLQKLHFTPNEFCISNAIMKINAIGNNIDNFSGEASISDFNFNTQFKNHHLNKINLSSMNAPTGKQLKLMSDVLNLNVDGNFNYSDLPIAFRNYINRYFPAYVKRSSRNQEALQQFQFSCNINDKENLLSVLVPGLQIIGETNLYGAFNSSTSVMNLKANFGEINFGKQKIKPLSVLLQGNADKIFGAIEANNIVITDSFIIRDSKMQFVAQHDSLRFNYNMAGDTALFAFDINGLATMYPNSISTHLLKSDFYLKGYHWSLLKDNEIDFSEGFWDFKNILLASREQSIAINSLTDNDKKDNLKVEFSSVHLQDLMDVVGAKSAELKGILNGSMLLSSYQTNPILSGDIDFKNCKVGENLLGNIVGKINYNKNIPKIFCDLKITQNENSLTAKGYYNLTDSVHLLNYDLALQNFNINSIEPFITDILSHKTGNLTGTATVMGNLKHPKITADVSLVNGGLTVNYLNTRYLLEPVHAVCQNNIIQFDKFNLHDTLGNTGVFTGNIDLNNLHRVLLDFHITTPKLMVMNTDFQKNQIFFGNAFAAGNIDITGVTYNLTIAAKAKTLKGTSLFIPISDDRDVTRHDFIQFETNKKDSITNSKNYVVDLDGLNLKFDIETTTDAEVNILMDLQAGDYIKGRGTGDIKIDFSTNRAFGMYGSYTMTRGEYYFTLFNIPKNFNINNGSTITWDGDAYNGTLDVVGTYSVRAAFADLIADLQKSQPEEYAKAKNKVPVLVKMMGKGSLKKPDITFDISPSDNTSTSIDFVALQRLQAIKADQNELNNQVFALLAMNSFIAPQNVGGFDNALTYNSTYKQSGSDLVSTQVSRLLNNALYRIAKDNKSQLNFNYRLYDQSADLRNQSQISATFTRQFINDRLKIDVGGVYDYGAVNVNNTNGLFADFNIEYNLTADGRLKIRGFRKTEYDVLYERNRNRTGLGLAYNKEFNRLHELFINYNRRKKNAKTLQQK